MIYYGYSSELIKNITILSMTYSIIAFEKKKKNKKQKKQKNKKKKKKQKKKKKKKTLYNAWASSHKYVTKYVTNYLSTHTSQELYISIQFTVQCHLNRTRIMLQYYSQYILLCNSTSRLLNLDSFMKYCRIQFRNNTNCIINNLSG